MSENDDYLLGCIEGWAWAGFYSAEEIQEMLGDVLEGDEDEEMLHAAVRSELDAKAAAEKSWPAIADCHRLDAAFEELERSGVIALHNAGYTMSEGLSDAGERLPGAELPRRPEAGPLDVGRGQDPLRHRQRRRRPRLAGRRLVDVRRRGAQLHRRGDQVAEVPEAKVARRRTGRVHGRLSRTEGSANGVAAPAAHS